MIKNPFAINGKRIFLGILIILYVRPIIYIKWSKVRIILKLSSMAFIIKVFQQVVSDFIFFLTVAILFLGLTYIL